MQSIDITHIKYGGKRLIKAIDRAVAKRDYEEYPSFIFMDERQYKSLDRQGKFDPEYGKDEQIYIAIENVMEVRITQ